MMAKISARGAKEVDRISHKDRTYVYTSDGRVLLKIKYSDGTSSGYELLCEGVTPEQWAEFKRESF